MWGFFFTTSLASRKRCGLHALNEQIRVEGAGPKPPPRSEDTESFQVGVVRHVHRDCIHGRSPRERIVFTLDDYSIAGVNKGDNCTKVLEADGECPPRGLFQRCFDNGHILLGRPSAYADPGDDLTLVQERDAAPHR